MTKESFTKLIEAHEGIVTIMDAMEIITQEHADGVMGVVKDNIMDVISVYSKYEYDYVTQNDEGLCGDWSWEELDTVLKDESLTAEQKCDIIYNEEKNQE